MTLTDFQFLVEQNARWFEGVHPETMDTIAEAERLLARPLPHSLVWLITRYGYSGACGISALDETVKVTLRAREKLGLPERYILLNDWQDAGVVLLDAEAPTPDGDYPVYWMASEHLLRLPLVEPTGDMDEYADFPAWVVSRLIDAQEEDRHPI